MCRLCRWTRFEVVLARVVRPLSGSLWGRAGSEHQTWEKTKGSGKVAEKPGRLSLAPDTAGRVHHPTPRTGQWLQAWV